MIGSTMHTEIYCVFALLAEALVNAKDLLERINKMNVWLRSLIWIVTIPILLLMSCFMAFVNQGLLSSLTLKNVSYGSNLMPFELTMIVFIPALIVYFITLWYVEFYSQRTATLNGDE